MSDSAQRETVATALEEQNSSLVADSLAIEVIGREGSIALFSGPRLIAARGLPRDRGAAASLIPAIEELAHEFLPQGSLSSLGSLSVAAGPGSFTGLRIAVTTAKTLGYALKIPLVAVNSLTAIAATAAFPRTARASAENENVEPASPVLVGLSAYRGQVYRGSFHWHQPPEIDLITAEQWKRELQLATDWRGAPDRQDLRDDTPSGNAETSEKKFVLLGDRAVFERSGVPFDPAQWCDEEVRAVGVGRIGAKLLQQGETTSSMDLVPDYLRPSAAEEQAGLA